MAIIVDDVGEQSIRLSRPSIGMHDGELLLPMTSSHCPVSSRRRRTRRSSLTHMEVRSTSVGWQDREQASLEECLFMERLGGTLGNTFAALMNATEEGKEEGRTIADATIAAAVVSRNNSNCLTDSTAHGAQLRRPRFEASLPAVTCYEHRVPWKMRRALRAKGERLPLNLLCHYETLLRSTVALEGGRVGQQQSPLQLSVSNSFHRLLIHAMARYYGLISRTLDAHLVLIEGPSLNVPSLGAPSEWFSHHLHDRFCR